MFEDLNITDKTNLDIKLYEEKSWITFQLIKASVNSDLHPEVNDWHSVEAIEHTLAYLKPLLERGELKAGRAYFDSKLGCHPMREYIGDAEKTIDAIRKEWLSADSPEKKWDADSFIGFSLPENPWKVYENH